MAQQFASYEAIARTESYEEENGVAVADGAGSGRGRRYVSVLAVLLAVVGTALLVTSTYSATAPAASQPVVSGTAFDSKLSATKIADLSETTSQRKSSKKSSKVDTINFEETFNPT